MKVHQVLSGAGPRDAVTSIAVGIRAQLREWGWDGGDHAARIAPGCPPGFSPLSGLVIPPEDVVLIHHSAAIPRLEEVLKLANPKLLLYHNVTPAGWFWEDSPMLAVHCEIGRAQLAELAPAVDLAAADSHFNAGELSALGARHTAVIPPLVDRGRLGPARSLAAQDGAGAPAPPAPHAPTILFVGRLSPHKRQDQVIRAFSLFARHHAPEARLVLVGEPITDAYTERLRRLAAALAPGAVEVESGLSDDELGDRYRRADAFLCLSAHEGFCIPLLEAMELGVPVIAADTGAVPEVVGDAGLLVPEGEELAVVAELLALVLSDAELRRELSRRAAARLDNYDRQASVSALRRALEGTVLAAGER